jgi:hypothetical protein
MMTNNEDAHLLIDYAEQKMKRKSFQIHASEILLPNRVAFRRFGCFVEKGSQLGVELICELWAGDVFVVFHDARNVGSDLPMKL